MARFQCHLYSLVISVLFFQKVFSDSDFGIFDVTTILRPPQDYHDGRLEVHTRTNALDLPTNFTDHHDPAAPFYPSNFNCNVQNTTNFGCTGWDIINWTLSGFDYYDALLAGSSKVNSLCYTVDSDTKACNYHYQWPENTTRAYLSFVPRSDVRDDFYVGFCDQVGLLSDRRRHCSGLKISFAPFEGFFYHSESFWLLHKQDDEFQETPNNEETKFNVMSSEQSVAPGFTWGPIDESYTVILENENNRGCIWVPNAPKQCFIQSDGNLMVSTNISEGMHLRTSPSVLKLNDNHGMLISPEFVGRNLSTICISVRYFLDENFSAEVKLTAVDAANNLIAESPEFKIAGRKSTSTRRFTMGLPQTLENVRWKLRFEVKSIQFFLIRSITGCLPSDGNIFYAPLQPQDEDVLRNITTNFDNPGFDYGSIPLHLRWTVPEYGFDVNHKRSFAALTTPKNMENTTAPEFMFCSSDYGLGCGEGERPLNVFTTNGCYNGGVAYLGGCKCLPGFKGPFCEAACPPDRFGADCRGHCSVTDHSGCRGKQLAAPGEKLECARGFTGPSCTTECGSGFYGPDCRLLCGKCKVGTCDRFSGHCNSPCLQGYRLALCQDRFDFNDEPPIITQVGYDFVEGQINFMHNRNLFDAYPYYKIQYKKPDESSWRSVLVEKQDYRNFADVFRIGELSPATNYTLRVVLVHFSGESYEGPELPTTAIFTLCNHCEISEMVVLPHDKHIKVWWKIVEKPFNCPREKFVLEIHMAPLAKPVLYNVAPDATVYTVNSILPRSRGSVRLRSVTSTGDTKYFPFVDFYRPALEHIANLSVAERGPRAIVLLWSTEENLDEAKFHIEYQCRPLICANTQCPSGRLDVTGNRAAIQNLLPFSQYIFSVDNHSIAAMTTADLPSEAPVAHPKPVFYEQSTGTGSWIQWLDPRCDAIHGILRGFRVELRQGNAVVNITEEYSSHSIGYNTLKPGTSYEAHIFAVNNKGWNPSKSLRIPFTTRAK